MLAGVVVEIDQLRSDLDRVESGLLHDCRFTDEGEHRAVVIDIGMLIEKSDARDRGNRRSDLDDDLRPPCFAEVGNAFDNPRHGSILVGE
jgi:hypothetical protein